jgi:hypothetical protein
MKMGMTAPPRATAATNAGWSAIRRSRRSQTIEADDAMMQFHMKKYAEEYGPRLE